MSQNNLRTLTFDDIQSAVSGTAAAFRCRIRLQPDAGDGGKVFPPTYAGGVYAVEDRRINGQVVRCVLLDSVQSQANRMEEALQDTFLPNWRELKTDSDDTQCALPMIAVHVENHGWITSLTAPHRIHDAILRDSNLNGTRFRDSERGKAVVAARIHEATAFYQYCPTVLLFGTWDSTAGEGLNSAKIPRAVVSEIIGVNVAAGVRTGSRLDPLGIARDSATIYRRANRLDDWTLEEVNAAKDTKGQAIRFGTGPRAGRPAAINHGNIPPDLARFGDRREVRNQHLDVLPDILHHEHDRVVMIEGFAVKPGGVTMEYALHTWTLSLTQLRRLRFPVEKSTDKTQDCNAAARTVLAALALYALALQNERGYWLRSRCELIPEGETKLELLGSTSTDFSLGSAQDVRKNLFEPALEEAEKLGLPWEKKVVRLTPTEELKKLVALSDAPRLEEEDADTEGGTTDDSTQG
jgi:CRISPR-associated protein Csb1